MEQMPFGGSYGFFNIPFVGPFPEDFGVFFDVDFSNIQGIGEDRFDGFTRVQYKISRSRIDIAGTVVIIQYN